MSVFSSVIYECGSNYTTDLFLITLFIPPSSLLSCRLNQRCSINVPHLQDLWVCFKIRDVPEGSVPNLDIRHLANQRFVVKIVVAQPNNHRLVRVARESRFHWPKYSRVEWTV